MKKLFMFIPLIFLYFNILTAQEVRIEEVFNRTITIDSTASQSYYFNIKELSCDTLHFQVEIETADSLTGNVVNNPLTGDSLSVVVKVLPYSVGGYLDSTTTSYWTTVVTKGATAGRYAAGAPVAKGAKWLFKGKGYVTITSLEASQQATIKIYAIRKFRRF